MNEMDRIRLEEFRASCETYQIARIFSMNDSHNDNF